MVGEPGIVKRTKQPYLGIRLQAPFRGMFTEVNKQFPALDKWLRQHGVAPAGPRFLRYHVIDMAGEMDVEVWSSPDFVDTLIRHTFPHLLGRFFELLKGIRACQTSVELCVIEGCISLLVFRLRVGAGLQ